MKRRDLWSFTSFRNCIRNESNLISCSAREYKEKIPGAIAWVTVESYFDGGLSRVISRQGFPAAVATQ